MDGILTEMPRMLHGAFIQVAISLHIFFLSSTNYHSKYSYGNTLIYQVFMPCSLRGLSSAKAYLA